MSEILANPESLDRGTVLGRRTGPGPGLPFSDSGQVRSQLLLERDKYKSEPARGKINGERDVTCEM